MRQHLQPTGSSVTTTATDSPTHTATLPRRRRTPTERQLESIHKLSIDSLVAVALVAMHQLNRRARKLRDEGHRYRRWTWRDRCFDQRDEIYALKNKFLDALVRAGNASVETFLWQRTLAPDSRRRFKCGECGHSWFGDDPECRGCGNFDTIAGEPLRPEPEVMHDQWFIVAAGEYRWHQPGEYATDAMRKVAVEVEPHNPDQPATEIPSTKVDLPGIGPTKLTIQAQHETVRLATERLLGQGIRDVDSPD